MDIKPLVSRPVVPIRAIIDQLSIPLARHCGGLLKKELYERRN